VLPIAVGLAYFFLAAFFVVFLAGFFAAFLVAIVFYSPFFDVDIDLQNTICS
jgi:hypothetical protein